MYTIYIQAVFEGFVASRCFQLTAPFHDYASQNHQLGRLFCFCEVGCETFNRIAKAHSDVALWGSVRLAFIQQLCSVPLSPSRYPQPAPVQLDCEAQASMQASMLVTLTLPTSTAWSPEKSIPQYCSNCLESASDVYRVLLDPGQVMLEVSGVAEADAEEDVAVGVPVEVGLAVTYTVVAADGLFRN